TRGGGLLMTGGTASFGSGGYFRSPLDDLLPVSLEQRQEHRKLSVALSVTLDRSGSMSAPAGAGVAQMDLANRGTVEALRLLAPTDSASVIAVDSSPHVIQPQAKLENRGSVESRVLGIQAQGGGIFTATALRASAQELDGAVEGTKHVILFADAADAEEQEDTPEVIELLRAMGATVSVIGLGTENDSDADFLKACALDGGGEAYFTESPEELPRLFAMDTQAVARSTFVEEPTAVEARRDLVGLGEVGGGGLGFSGFPTIDGYNLTYLRQDATLAAVTTDEYSAPVFAFHARGLGRTAALTAQVGGSAGTSLAQWEGLPSFLVTAVRWLSGVEPPEGVFASVEREGAEAVVTVELDPSAAKTAIGESLAATVTRGEGVESLVLERVSSTRFEARFPLRADEVALAAVELNAGDGGEPMALTLPPVALPYSPEYERPPDPGAGARLLKRLADRTGGVTNVAASEIFRGERSGSAWRVYFSELLTLAMLLLIIEIAGRRLGLWPTSLGRVLQRPSDSRAKPVPSGPARGAAAATPRLEQRPESTASTTTGESDGAEALPGLGGALESARRSSESRLKRGR
ncbi:MAG: vWA domain-containing protein, partial [Planctomycetota bacterium]